MNLLKSKRFYCVLALLAAPATLKALSDYYYTIVYYGSIGTSNYLAGSRTLGVGTNHIIPYYCSDSAAIGSVLNVQYPNSVVVGKYNQTTDSAAVFVVGNGSSSVRTNALEVRTDGRVIISGTADITKVPERGGISMGIYTP